jgi:hypothetical protein
MLFIAIVLFLDFYGNPQSEVCYQTVTPRFLQKSVSENFNFHVILWHHQS